MPRWSIPLWGLCAVLFCSSCEGPSASPDVLVGATVRWNDCSTENRTSANLSCGRPEEESCPHDGLLINGTAASELYTAECNVDGGIGQSDLDGLWAEVSLLAP